MKKSLFILSLVALGAFTSCAKVSPEVTLLLKSKLATLFPATSPQAGKMTLGSNPATVTSGAYTLRGRVNFAATTTATSGPYQLKSSVRF